MENTTRRLIEDEKYSDGDNDNSDKIENITKEVIMYKALDLEIKKKAIYQPFVQHYLSYQKKLLIEAKKKLHAEAEIETKKKLEDLKRQKQERLLIFHS